MLIYFDEDHQGFIDRNGGRYIPYLGTELDEDGAYFDFVSDPLLIPTSLEDFRPYGEKPAVKRFYSLIEWLNGPESVLETTDCLLRPPGENKTLHLGKGAALQIIGRLVFIYRDHSRNVCEIDIARLSDAFETTMRRTDTGWDMGACGYALYHSHFSKLGDEPDIDKTIGAEVCVRYWVWGNDEAECFDNLDRLYGNLDQALRQVSAQVSKP